MYETDFIHENPQTNERSKYTNVALSNEFQLTGQEAVKENNGENLLCILQLQTIMNFFEITTSSLRKYVWL